MAKKWIDKAIGKEGSLTRQAKAVGESPMAFAAEHKGDVGTTGKRARLALTLQGFHGREKIAPKRNSYRRAK